MPLRVRLIAMIGLVLLASLAGGSVLLGWRATQSVQTELRAALEVGAQTMRNGIDDLAQAGNLLDQLRSLVATFNGNRHVRATLLDAEGHIVAASALLPPPQQIPAWFLRLIGGKPRTIRLSLTGSVVVLQTDSTNETGEVWAQSRDAVLILAGFALTSAVLLSLVVGRTLRSLEKLSGAFAHIGLGDYHALLPMTGPTELRRLAGGFNTMTQRIAAASAQNQRLNERLLTLQAEERADIARDLHDEIGPLLFAVDMTAGAIQRLAQADRSAEIPNHVGAIHDAVAQVQRHVRALLGRLRPIQTIGLTAAIDRLIAFWRVRRPNIAFDLTLAMDEDELGSDLKETIYRIVQEGITNAIQHGRPTRVEIAVMHEGDDTVRVTVVDDGVGMAASAATSSPRFGLIGMRERVMAVAGSLSVQPGVHGRGLSLIVRLPCETTLQNQRADAPE